MEDVRMNEFEKKVIDEMDAAEMLAMHREEHPVEDRAEVQSDEYWDRVMVRGAEGYNKRRRHRQGWEAFWLACYHGLVALACAGALVGGPWGLILVGIGISNLIMMGGWLHKAKAGWSV